MGEDFKYLSEAEVTSPQKLFTDLNADLDGSEESTNPELAYLAVNRQIRDNDPELYALVKRLPKKAKAAKHTVRENDGTVTFIRKGALKSFFITEESDTRQLTFMEAIRLIECTPEEDRASVGSVYYDHLKTNSEAFDLMLIEDEEISLEKPMVAGNDAKVIKVLKAIKADGRLTDDEEAKIAILINRWENGEIPARVSKDVVKAMKFASDSLELFYAIMRIVPDAYLEERREKKAFIDSTKEIVLSCYLRGGNE